MNGQNSGFFAESREGETEQVGQIAPFDLAEAEAYCRRLAKQHYENFALVSVFIPRRLHQHIYNIYAFARIADDFADEGTDPTENLRRLEDWERQLEACVRGKFEHPVFLALSRTIGEFDLPLDWFRQLLSAFKQDQIKNRYETFAELLGYCRNSANPVGRIYLQLFGLASPERFAASDQICTALQLTNFWQDVSLDFHKGRVYIPLEDLRRFAVDEAELGARQASASLRRLIRFEVERTRKLFESGRALENMVPPGLKRQIRLFVGGGLAILDAITRQDYDVLSGRPELSRWQKMKLLAGAVRR